MEKSIMRCLDLIFTIYLSGARYGVWTHVWSIPAVYHNRLCVIAGQLCESSVKGEQCGGHAPHALPGPVSDL